MTGLFWNWLDDPDPDSEVRVLHINGAIAGESWFDDDIASVIFNSGINAGSGDVMIWVNSPGGDVVAATHFYNMLLDFPGHVTVNIDGIAASAASVIAMDARAASAATMRQCRNGSTRSSTPASVRLYRHASVGVGGTGVRSDRHVSLLSQNMTAVRGSIRSTTVSNPSPQSYFLNTRSTPCGATILGRYWSHPPLVQLS